MKHYPTTKKKHWQFKKGHVPWNKDKDGWAGIGEKHFNYKGGRNISLGGYVRVLIPGKMSYEFEHRRVMERHLGRKLSRNECIHHLDGDRTNNDISNLELIVNSDHMRVHSFERKRDLKGRFL